MKYLFAAIVVMAGSLAGLSAASAAGGCGPGFHRARMAAAAPMDASSWWSQRQGSWSRLVSAPAATSGAMAVAGSSEDRRRA
jgi:hypothetical protein